MTDVPVLPQVRSLPTPPSQLRVQRYHATVDAGGGARNGRQFQRAKSLQQVGVLHVLGICKITKLINQNDACFQTRDSRNLLTEHACEQDLCN